MADEVENDGAERVAHCCPAHKAVAPHLDRLSAANTSDGHNAAETET